MAANASLCCDPPSMPFRVYVPATYTLPEESVATDSRLEALFFRPSMLHAPRSVDRSKRQSLEKRTTKPFPVDCGG